MRWTGNLNWFSATWPALFSNGLLFFQLYVQFGVHRCFCLLFVFAFWLHPQHMEVPWVGLNLSLSCDLHHSCGNTGTLTHCARLGIQPVPLQWPELLQSDPLSAVPQQELLHRCFFFCCFFFFFFFLLFFFFFFFYNWSPLFRFP